MRYLIAPDKFKGTLSAQEVAETIAAAIRKGDPIADIDLLPVADGGEGTATLLATQLFAERKVMARSTQSAARSRRSISCAAARRFWI